MSDLVSRLRDEANQTKNWLTVRELLNEAASEIERLRLVAGAVTSGPSLSDVKAELKAKPCAAPNAGAAS